MNTQSTLQPLLIQGSQRRVCVINVENSVALRVTKSKAKELVETEGFKYIPKKKLHSALKEQARRYRFQMRMINKQKARDQKIKKNITALESH